MKSPEDSPSDALLVAAVCCDPPDEAALDLLVERHWQTLFARCHLMTLDHQKARDLAQATWCRLLRARQALKPEGNFPAYLKMIATNLWRDSYRSAQRAGPMAGHRLVSLDSEASTEDDEAIPLIETLADLNTLQPEQRIALKLDLDKALEKLPPQLRDVLLARFIDGESCAEIGRRHQRTEQAVSGWVREAIRQIRSHLEDPAAANTIKS